MVSFLFIFFIIKRQLIKWSRFLISTHKSCFIIGMIKDEYFMSFGHYFQPHDIKKDKKKNLFVTHIFAIYYRYIRGCQVYNDNK